MSPQTFLIIGAALIGIPFMVSCFKGDPFIGLIAGIGSFLLMAFALSHGTSPLAVLALGFVLAGMSIAFSRNGT